MTAPRDPDRLIRAFLAEGQAELPDRTYDAVREHIDRTRQRVVIGPWRVRDMSAFARLATAAVIVLAIGLAWTNLRPSQNGVGAAPTPSPTAGQTTSPAPSAAAASPAGSTPMPISDGPLEPGRYRFSYFPPISITVPAGWSASQAAYVTKDYGKSDSEVGAGLGVWNITNRYVDGCTNHALLDPAPGPGIDELIAALSSQPGVSASTPTDVTVDGFHGKVVELTVTSDIAACGPQGFWLWGEGRESRFVQGTNEVNRIYVLDINGMRRTFFARIPAITTPADRAELEAIIASIDIEA